MLRLLAWFAYACGIAGIVTEVDDNRISGVCNTSPKVSTTPSSAEVCALDDTTAVDAITAAVADADAEEEEDGVTLNACVEDGPGTDRVDTGAPPVSVNIWSCVAGVVARFEPDKALDGIRCAEKCDTPLGVVMCNVGPNTRADVCAAVGSIVSASCVCVCGCG